MSEVERHQRRVATRVHDQAVELAAATAAVGLSTLSYLLDMTAMEAERVLRELGKPKQ